MAGNRNRARSKPAYASLLVVALVVLLGLPTLLAPPASAAATVELEQSGRAVAVARAYYANGWGGTGDCAYQRVEEGAQPAATGFVKTVDASATHSAGGSACRSSAQASTTVNGSVTLDARGGLFGVQADGSITARATGDNHNGYVAAGYGVAGFGVSFRVNRPTQYSYTETISGQTYSGEPFTRSRTLSGELSVGTHRFGAEATAEAAVSYPGHWSDPRVFSDEASGTFSFSLSLARPAVDLDFDYVAQPRYGLDANNDGLTDQLTTAAAVSPPDGFPIDLSVATCPANARVVWRSGTRALGEGCAVTARLPEGSHDVEVQAFDDGSDQLIGAKIEQVVVNDILIVSLGDSVASGEGANEKPVPVVGWGDNQCHRSAAAGPSVAAKALEAASTRSSVTFVHLACSGATIHKGILGPYDGIVPGVVTLPPQIQQMTSLVRDRQIDALTISIGANDVQFSKIIELCMADPSCELPASSLGIGVTGFGLGAAHFASLAPNLPAAYAQLAGALHNLRTPAGDRAIPGNRIFLTEYYNPMRDTTGAPCDGGVLADAPTGTLTQALGPTLGPLVGGAVSQVADIDADEARWAEQVMLTELNRLGDEAAANFGWQRVSGMFADFAPHGYCTPAGQRWVETFTDSMASQGDQNGSVHPNIAGHAQSYGPRIEAAIRTVVAP